MKNVFVLFALSLTATAGVITFDEPGRSDGETLSNQYAGVNFTAGISGASGILNPVGSTQGFATNTAMQLTTSDTGGGVFSPISGRLLHTFSGWLNEDGDAAFTIDFSNPVTFFSIDVGGVAVPASTVLYAVDGSNTAIGSVAATVVNTSTLSLTPSLAVTRFVITIGDFNDWVGVDNINYTESVQAVPEPATIGLIGIGLAIVALRRRNS